MKFTEITAESKIFPGEYVLHKPSNAVVLVGAFNRDNGTIKVLKDGKLLTDDIENFRKIALNRKEFTKYKKSTCSKCKGGGK